MFRANIGCRTTTALDCALIFGLWQICSNNNKFACYDVLMTFFLFTECRYGKKEWFTVTQKEILLDKFSYNQNPSVSEIEKIANELCVPLKKVQVIYYW